MPNDEKPVAKRVRIEIVGLGQGTRGFKLLRLNGEERDDATLLMDLHSELRVRMGDEIYTADNAEIVVTDA